MRVTLRFLAVLGLALGAPPAASGQAPAVHAVLFYSPTCPHCHDVINNDLPPLRERYGDQFVVVGVDVTTRGGQALYQATVAYFDLPDSRLGVPAMVVGTNVMVGSLEIPEQLPGLIERGLATGGIDWPPIDEVRDVLAAQGLLRPSPAPDAEEPPTDTAASDESPAAPPSSASPEEESGAVGEGPRIADAGSPEAAADPAPAVADPGSPGAMPADAPAPSAPPAETAGVTTDLSGVSGARVTLSVTDRLLGDPVGNGLAVGVFLLLLVALAWSALAVAGTVSPAPRLPAGLFPVLAVVGMAVAAYLSFVEITGAEAVCGPVGDCNTVQQSPWARLFGVLPVGVLGLGGYLALLASWWVGRGSGTPQVRESARSATWGLAWVGTAFSAWLTFLEPFVIGATCAWCVTSALVMAAMLAVATGEMSAAPQPPQRPAAAA